MKLYLKIFWLLLYFFIFLLLFSHSFSYLDNDYGWHWKIGESIIKEKRVPRINENNYTLKGVFWVDHEWLMNAFVYLAESQIGYIGLTVVFALLVLLCLVLLHYFINTVLNDCFSVEPIYFPKGDGIIIFIFLLGIAGSMPHLGIRMQEIALLNLLILLIALYYFEKTQNKYCLAILPPLFYFWACSHASFLLGIILLLLWIIAKSVELILKGKKIFSFIDFDRAISKKSIIIFSLFSSAAIAATAITPYGIGLYEFLRSYKNTYIFTHIEEWMPIYYYPLPVYQMIFISLAAAAVVINIYNSLAEKRDESGKFYKINLWQTGIAILFILMSIKARRHFPLLFIAATPFMVVLYKRFLLFKLNFKYAGKLILFPAISLYLCLIALSGFILLKTKFINEPAKSYCDYYPCKAVKFIKASDELRDLKLFNEYGWGGYLIWVWPEKQLFIDGRLPQYEFAGHTMLEEYGEFNKEKTTGKKLNDYGIQMALLPKLRQINLAWYDKFFFHLTQQDIDKESELLSYLQSNWKIAYKDETSYVFIKK